MSEFLQLPFDFPRMTSYGSDNFYVSSGNRKAFDIINGLPEWNTFANLIYGEKGCGKTHLAKFAQEKEPNSIIINAADLDLFYRPENRLVIIEDIETANEEALFHLFNTLKNDGLLLLTAEAPVNRLPFRLKDLKSRLLTVPEIAITAPDDELILALVIKHCNDLQADINNDGLQYILKNVERSFTAVHKLIERIDFLSRSQKRKITVPLIKTALY